MIIDTPWMPRLVPTASLGDAVAASTAEVTAGTDNAKFITPAALDGSDPEFAAGTVPNQIAASVNPRAPAQGLVFGGSAGPLFSGISAFGAGGITVAGYVKADLTTAQQTIVDGENAFNFYVLTDGKIGVYDYVTPGTAVASAVGVIKAGKTHFVVYTRGNLYVDGVNVATGTDSANYAAPLTRIGQDFGSNNELIGSLSGLLIYTRSITETEVRTLSETGSFTSISTTDLVFAADATQSGSGTIYRSAYGTAYATLPASGVTWALPSSTTHSADIWADGYASIKAAVDSLPAAGGTVRLRNNVRYISGYTGGANYLGKDNVSIIGEKMPYFSTDRLVGGSIISGMLAVFANNFTIKNCGVDAGAFERGANAATDAFSFSDYASAGVKRTNVNIENFIGLCKAADSAFHAVLMEGVNGIQFFNVRAKNGVHGVVVKSTNVNGFGVFADTNSSENLIIKSDAAEKEMYSVNISNINCTGAGAWGVLVEAVGATGSQVNLNGITCNGTKTQVGVEARSNGSVLSDVNISNVVVDGSATGIKNAATRCAFSNIVANNATYGINYTEATGAVPSLFSNIRLTNVTNGVYFDGPVQIDNIRFDTVTTAWVPTAATSKPYIGTASYLNVTNIIANYPTLANGWAEYGGGNSTYSVRPEGGGIRIKGLIGSGSATADTVCTLPASWRPTTEIRVVVGTNTTPLMINVGANGAVVISRVVATDYASLDGVFIPLQ
jgi:hypothetical protein